MKILIFATPFYPRKSGLGNYVLTLSNRLANKGHEITILCYDTENTKKYFEKLGKLNVLRIKTKKILDSYHLANKKHLKKILKKLDKEDFDTIITNTRFFESSIIGMNYSKRRKINWIHIEHGTSFVQTNNPIIWLGSRLFDLTLGRKILNNAKTIVAISRSVKDFVKKISKNKKIIVIPNGIEFKEFPTIKKREIRNLIFIGRLIYGKGVQDLIESFSQLKDKNTKLTIIGDGPYKKQLEHLTKEKKLQNRIVFLGEKTHEEVLKILSEHDLFINPSYTEGLPTTVLEAGMVGLPVIATNVGGTSEVIKNKESGLLIKSEDRLNLKKAIEFIIKNHKEREKYSKNLQNNIKKSYEWKKIIERWENLLKKI